MIIKYIKRGERRRFARRKEYALQFPNQCACCNGQHVGDEMNISHKALGRHRLVVPYCSKHAKVISYHTLLSMFVTPSVVVIAFVSIFFLQIYWGIGVGTNSWAKAVVGLFIGSVFGALISSAGSKLINKMVGNEYKLNEKGAVVISKVEEDLYSLSFDNKEYADSFAALNAEHVLLKIQDAPNETEKSGGLENKQPDSKIMDRAEDVKGIEKTPIDESDPFP